MLQICEQQLVPPSHAAPFGLQVPPASVPPPSLPLPPSAGAGIVWHAYVPNSPVLKHEVPLQQFADGPGVQMVPTPKQVGIVQ